MCINLGASEYVAHNEHLMTNMKEVESLSFEFENAHTIDTSPRGYINIDFGAKKQSLSRIYLIPDARLNLFSYTRVEDNEVKTTLSKRKCVLTDLAQSNRIIGAVLERKEDDLYAVTIVTFRKHIGSDNFTRAQGSSKNYIDATTELWHLRLLHANESFIKDMIKADAYYLKPFNMKELPACETSVTTNQAEKPATGNYIKIHKA